MGGRGRTKEARSGWMRHSALLLVEVVLVLGLVEDLLQGLLLGNQQVSPQVRVAAGMALSLGLLGGVTLLVQRQIALSLRMTHDLVAQRVLRVPRILAHAVVLTAIFVAYAWLWDAETGAFRELLGWAERARRSLLGR